MELSFQSKGVAVISVMATGFSTRQCAKLFEMTEKQIGTIAAVTKRRKHQPEPITDDLIFAIEGIVGQRGRGKRVKRESRITKEPGTYRITINLSKDFGT